MKTKAYRANYSIRIATFNYKFTLLMYIYIFVTGFEDFLIVKGESIIKNKNCKLSYYH